LFALTWIGSANRDLLKRLLGCLWEKEIQCHGRAAEAFAALEAQVDAIAERLHIAAESHTVFEESLELVRETLQELQDQADEEAQRGEPHGSVAQSDSNRRVEEMHQEVHKFRERTSEALTALRTTLHRGAELLELMEPVDLPIRVIDVENQNGVESVESVAGMTLQNLTPPGGSSPGDAEGQSEQGSSSLDSWEILSNPGGNHCFMPESLFMLASGHVLVPASELSPGSLIVAADGNRTLKVTNVTSHCTERVTELEAGGITIRVTPDHRIVTPTGVALAEELKEGDCVTTSFGSRCLTSAETRPEQTMVLAITFSPDEPVATFLPPQAIWSMGQAASGRRTRRSGMNRRGQASDAVSIPETAPGMYRD